LVSFSMYEVVCITVSHIVGLSFSWGRKQTNYTTDSDVNDFINAKSHAPQEAKETQTSACKVLVKFS